MFRRTDSSKTAEGGKPSATDRSGRPNDGSDDGNGGDSTTFEERMAELEFRRMRSLYAVSRRRSKRIEAGLCDAVHEDGRLKTAIRELEEKLCEATANVDELEAERKARRTVGHERVAKASRLKAENRKLTASLSESARRVDETERRADAAERRADETKRRADEVAERRPVLSSAVDDLRDVLRSAVVDLRGDALQTVVDKLLYVLEVTTADGRNSSRSYL